MLSLYRPIAVSSSLLDEVARTGWLVDPMLFCYASWIITTVLACTVGYFLFGRTSPRRKRRARAHRLVTTAHARWWSDWRGVGIARKGSG